MMIGRIDYQKSDKHSIFGRYLIEQDFNPPAYDLSKNLLSAGNGDDGRAQAFTLGDTYLFGAGIVNSFRLSGNRLAGGKTSPDFKDCNCGSAAIGIQAYNYTPNDPRINVTGGFAVSAQGGPTKLATFAGTDDLSIVHGNHQLALGVNSAYWWVNSYSGAYYMNFAFNGQTTGLGLADFLTGEVSQFVNGTSVQQHNRSKSFGAYAADTWKLNQRWTLNYGFRWEPYFPQVNTDRSSIHYDEAALKAGVKTNRFINAPPGVFFDTDPGFPGHSGMNNQWWNFSPRVGLAWDVSGDGRTSVRLSAGTFYDYPAAIYQRSLTTVPPWTPRIQLNNVKFDTPWRNYPGGDPFPQPFGRNLPKDIAWVPFSIVTAMDYGSPTMRVGQWNLSVQKQVGTDWLVSASYLGNATRHMWTTRPLNSALFLGLGACTINGVQYTTCSTTANTNQRRRLFLENPVTGQSYGYVNQIDTGGTANYNGLLLSVQRRAARGITISGNYTWSHCIGDMWQETAQSTNADQGWSDANNRRRDRGNCSTSAVDRRHLFNFSSVAETPRFSNATLRLIGSGWRISPIFKVISGGYLTITTNQDRALNGMSGQRVNQILGDPYGDKTVGNYLNPKAFTLPDLGTLPNMGRANIRGPRTLQFDMALSRTFQVRESQKVEFRAEAFNVTNSLILNDPVVNLNSNTFGQVTSAKDPRIMQFALKYFF
jgi:hypothetical protein